MSSSGVSLRPRYGRIVALAAATSTTLVSLVGTVVAGPADDPAATVRPQQAAEGGLSLAAASAALATAPSIGLRASLAVGLPSAIDEYPSTTDEGPGTTEQDSATTGQGPGASSHLPATTAEAAEATEPPARSGTGRRVVFSESDQRVWLVRENGDVVRSYLVSGSVYDNLDPGTYEVYSRSATATGIDGSELRWMVRFTQGANAAIGFHWIPRMNGKPMQSRAELGTPLSHGCVRQAAPDAKALWRFAPVGTTVVVTA